MAVLWVVLALLAAGCLESDGFVSSDDEAHEYPFNIIISPVAYGSVTSNRKNAGQNDNISLTIIPNAGYSYVEGSLSVTSLDDGLGVAVGGGGILRSFNMPASHVVVSAVFEPVMYNITIQPSLNGTITANADTAAIGTIITLTITPQTGFILLDNTLSILQDNGASVNQAGYVFTMPASNITISAQFSMLYNINVNQTGSSGDVFTSHDKTVAGTPITVIVTPQTGHRIKKDSFSITGAGSGTQISTELTVTGYYTQTHTFSMPAFDITVNVEFEVIPPGVVAVYFDGFHDENMDLTQSGNTIRRGFNDIVIVTVADGFDNYYWYVDDVLKSYLNGYTTITVDGYMMELGLHTITAVVVKNGVPYSKIVTFMVVN